MQGREDTGKNGWESGGGNERRREGLKVTFKRSREG